MRSRITALVLGLLLASCQTYTSTLFLQNETSVDLVPYPVVTVPAPPHREADPSNTVPPNGRLEIDAEGFNPLFYTSSIVDPAAPNALFVGLAFYGDDPPLIQIKLMHYVVPPGQEGTDPAKQPVVLRERIEEVNDEDLVIRLIQAPPGGPGDLPLSVKIEPDSGP